MFIKSRGKLTCPICKGEIEPGDMMFIDTEGRCKMCCEYCAKGGSRLFPGVYAGGGVKNIPRVSIPRHIIQEDLQ